MFFRNIIKRFWSTFLVLLFVNQAFAVSDVNYFVSDNIAEVKKIIMNFEDEEFNQYLIDASHYSLSDYQTAIYRLFLKYRNDFSKVNSCVETITELEKKYNDQWVDDLIAFAGKDYLKKNIKSFQQLIYNIHSNHINEFCLASEKDVLFSETQYVTTVIDFLKLYISFIETIPEPKRAQYIKNMELAKSIIHSSNNSPFQVMRFGGKVGVYLNVTHNIKLKSDAIEFVINHPTFAKPFSLFKAIKDLRKISSGK